VSPRSKRYPLLQYFQSHYLVARTAVGTGEIEGEVAVAVEAGGDLGGGDDAELLRSLATDGDKRIALCARAALARLNKRLGTSL
jgi:hypothetical protein